MHSKHGRYRRYDTPQKVGELEFAEYRKICSKLGSMVPGHWEIKRRRDKGVVEIWSRRPELVADAIEELLGMRRKIHR